MSREWPIPSVANTLHVVGDMHHEAGVVWEARLAKAQADILRMPTYPRLYAGDITNLGTPTQDAVALAWMDGVPGERFEVCGNHDVYLNVRTVDQFASAYGAAKNWSADLGWVRLIGVAPDDDSVPRVLSAATLSWLDSTLAVSTKDCWIFCHYPLYNTVLDAAGEAQYVSTEAGFYLTPDADIRAILNSRSRAKAWIAGHTHSQITAADLVKLESVGSRSVVSINASAPAYTGRVIGLFDPIHSVYLTHAGSAIEARYRNHGAGVWDAVPGWGRVASIPVPA